MPSPSRAARGAVVLAVGTFALLGVAACSRGGGGGGGSAATSSVAPMLDPAVVPLVEQIRPAIAAVEAELGGPQQFFEINATARLVNLFVSLNNGTIAQPWVFVDGELSSKPGQAAQGHSFAAAALTFDAATVLGPARAQLAGSAIDLFVVEGGEGGTVRYTLHVTSPAGGQLLVTVAPDGAVQGVETLAS